DAKRSTHEGAGDLGDQLLLGILLRSEAAGEITIESLRRASPMTELVQGRPVPVDGLEISVGPRHLDEIIVGVVEGAIAAEAEGEPILGAEAALDHCAPQD